MLTGTQVKMEQTGHMDSVGKTALMRRAEKMEAMETREKTTQMLATARMVESMVMTEQLLLLTEPEEKMERRRW